MKKLVTPIIVLASSLTFAQAQETVKPTEKKEITKESRQVQQPTNTRSIEMKPISRPKRMELDRHKVITVDPKKEEENGSN